MSKRNQYSAEQKTNIVLEVLREEKERVVQLERKVGQLIYEVNWLKKYLTKSSDTSVRQRIIEKKAHVSVKRQAELLEVNRTRKSRKNAETPSAPSYQIFMYYVAIYIRLSVEDNKKRGNSIESQRSILDNFMALNPDFKLYDVYIDNGTTDGNFERDGCKRMMEAWRPERSTALLSRIYPGWAGM